MAYFLSMATATSSTDTRGVATITIDNPPVNLMTVDVFVEIATLGSDLANDDDVRVVVLRSANPEWFIAHFDVEAIMGFPHDRRAATELNGFHRMCELFRTMRKPTIAVIEGRVGGDDGVTGFFGVHALEVADLIRSFQVGEDQARPFCLWQRQ